MSAKKRPAVPETRHRGRRSYQKISHIFANAETVQKAREVWWGLTRAYDKNLMSSAKYRDLNSGFKTLLGYLLAERDGRIEERLTALEEKLGIMTTGGPRAAS